MALELAQDSTYIGEDSWRWSVWLEPDSEAELAQVDRVIYTLHPSFPNPVRTVTDRSTKFRLETEGWGTFRLFATVVYVDRTEQVLQLDLKFDYPEEAQRRAPTPPKREAPEEASAVSAEAQVGSADGIFEGSGVKAVAFAGALMAAYEVAGIERWVNVAGTSGGSIIATLLAAGYRPEEIKEILRTVDYHRLTRFGLAGAFNLFTRRGLSRPVYFGEWLSHLLANSPLRDPDPPFAAFAHAERKTDLSPTSKFRLRIIASDISSSRMLVLPDDVDGYEDEHGRPLSREGFKVVEAVKMSISAPFLYTPGTLYRKGRPHYIVDGSLLSTFPLSLFDDPLPLRPTWGFRLHNVAGDEELPYRKIGGGPFAMVGLLTAVLESVMDAWDKQRVPADTVARTVIIPTSGIRRASDALSAAQLTTLFEAGYTAGRDFFGPHRQYVNSFGAQLAGAAEAPQTLER